MNKTIVEKTLRILREFMLPHWPIYAVLFAFSGFMSVIGLIPPYLTKEFFDGALVNRDFQYFLVLLAAFLGLQLFNQVFSIFKGYNETKLNQKLETEMRVRLFRHLESLHLGFLKKKQTGDLIARIESDAESVFSVISLVSDQLIIGTFTGIITLYVALTLDWRVTVAALAVFPVYMITERYFLKRLLEYRRSMVGKGTNVGSFIYESISGLLTVKLFGREQDQAKELERKTNELNTLSLQNLVTNSASGAITGFLLYVPTFVVLGFGGYQVVLGLMTIGTLLALQQYVARAFGPFLNLVNLNRSLQFAMVNVDRVFEVLDTEPAIKDKPNAKRINPRGHVTFEKVSFAYDNPGPVLENISFDINAGDRVAIVGSSGVGKTTLAHLLLRLYDPSQGRILLDGLDLRDIQIQSLREATAVVPQEIFLFNTTIKENIRFGQLDASDNQIIAAAKAANAHEFISALPQGYDTVVGERGWGLSDGQKQRVAIARALVRNPRIFVLDEPTSAMDSESEDAIMTSLRNLSRDKTVIIIAHRLSTVRDADRILVLDKKRLVEQGNFKELTAKKGRFWQLYRTQIQGAG